MVEAGREELPDTCLTCAFRPGCMTNQMAATGVLALNCVLGVDPDDFACHHGMKDGQPTKLCAGYLAAKEAAYDDVIIIVQRVGEQLAEQSGPDEVREAFDVWWNDVDPSRVMDNYELGRAYAAHLARQP